VFATMRRPDLGEHGVDVLPLDVTDDASVFAAITEVMARSGRIDAIVNNAGIDMAGAAEETTSSEAERLFQTNFFGVHRLNRAVLPVMRQQGFGRIVTIGSIAGFLPTPFDAFYCASKHAIKGYTEALRFEVEPLGIKCILIEPGFIKTELRAKKISSAKCIDAYATGRAKATISFDKSVSGGIPAEKVAAAIAYALKARNPKMRILVGHDAHMLAFIRRFLPESIFRFGLNRQFR
jgi:short-subunit dehydrogenase